MFLRNYYNYMAMLHFGLVSAAGSFGDGYLSLKNTSGSLTYAAATTAVNVSAASLYNLLKTAGPSNTYLSFGSGSTPASFDDYKIESVLSNIYSWIAIPSTFVYDAAAKKWSLNIALTICNTGSPANLREIGILAKCYSGYALIYHLVLDMPIAINSGRTVTATFTIEYQMP